MSLTITQIITVVAPQYSVDSDLANAIILATQRTSESAFGENYTYAIALRTAHILTLRDLNKDGITSGFGGATGNITSKREGGNSVTFGSNTNISSNANDLALTRYGIELLGLINGNICGFSSSNYTDGENNLLPE